MTRARIADRPNEDALPEEAVVLSGGGAHGAYQIGVLKALADGACAHTGFRRIEPRIFAGTSTGAFNAAVLTSHDRRGTKTALRFLEDTWRDKIAHIPGKKANSVFRLRGNPAPYLEEGSLFFNPLRGFRELAEDGAYLGGELMHRLQHFLVGDGSLEKKIVEFPNFSDFVSVEPMRQLVRESIDPDAIKRSRVQLRLAATHWKEGTVAIFDNASMHGERAYQTVMASTAIPAIFPPQKVGSELYVDGAARLNTPLKPAIAAADPETHELNLHVIYLDPHTEDLPLPHPPNTIATMYRLYTIMVARTIHSDVAQAHSLNKAIRQHRLYKHLSAVIPEDKREEDSAAGRMESHRKKLDAVTQDRREITIHRYEPTKSLGGMLSLLDFKLEVIDDMIELGYQDAVNHQCTDCALAGDL